MLPKLRALQKLLERDGFDVQRFTSLMNASSKDDPLDCKYVQLCLKDFMQKHELGKFTELKDLLREISSELND